jgi:XapX domain-containing protein
MKPYLISLAAGLLVGAIYGVLNVRSPAPPVIALVGLLGILLGEQAAPLAKKILSGERVTLSWVNTSCREHVFGTLPGASKGGDCQPDVTSRTRDC